MASDVLEVLRKLPPACAVWLEGEQRGVMVKRGAGFSDFLLATKDSVSAYNTKHGVTEAQVECMMAGATLGWDSEGADLKDPANNIYIYETVFRLVMSVNDATEDGAAYQARKIKDRVANWLETQDLGEGVQCLCPDTHELDLIETSCQPNKTT